MSQTGAVHTVTVTGLVYGGDAMGRLPDGRAVFVPYCLPGETVRVRLVEEKRGFARGELLEVVTPVPERLPPHCSTYTACGGCHYQHMPYEMQLTVKQEILAEQLKRIGSLRSPLVYPTVPSPQVWNYRNNAQLHISPSGQLGFQQPGTNQVVPLDPECRCPLCAPVLNEIIPQLDVEFQPDLERVALRLGVDDEIMIVLEGKLPEAPDLLIEELPVSVVHLSPHGQLLLAGSDHLFVEVLGREFKVSAGSFFQVNQPVAAKMVEYLLAHLPLGPQTTLLELYSGVGLFSAFLAGRLERLVAIESAPSAVSDFEANLDEFDNVEVYEAPVEAVIGSLDLRPQVVLADPPRAGLDKTIIAGLERLQPEILAYISCDPATLARDARYLAEAGYHLDHVTPFDMFPQTYHIESISYWKREGLVPK